MTTTTNTKIMLRRDTAANWTSVNPILNAGEPGFEIDTLKLKIGDGRTAWNTLEYVSGCSSEIDIDFDMFTRSKLSVTQTTDDIRKNIVKYMLENSLAGAHFFNGEYLGILRNIFADNYICSVYTLSTGEYVYEGTLRKLGSILDLDSFEWGVVNKPVVVQSGHLDLYNIDLQNLDILASEQVTIEAPSITLNHIDWDEYRTEVSSKIDNVVEIAEGKTKSYVIAYADNSKFNSSNDYVTLLNTDKIKTKNNEEFTINDLRVGDIIYVEETNVPDRWVHTIGNDGSYALFYKMETSKVNLDEYYTKSEVSTQINNAISLSKQTLASDVASALANTSLSSSTMATLASTIANTMSAYSSAYEYPIAGLMSASAMVYPVAGLISTYASDFTYAFNNVLSGYPSMFGGAIGTIVSTNASYLGSQFAAVISANPSTFTEPFNQVISGYPSMFGGAIAALISTNYSYVAYPMAQTIAYYPNIFASSIYNAISSYIDSAISSKINSLDGDSTAFGNK